MGINCHLMDVTEATNTDPVTGSCKFAYKDMTETEGIDIFARVALMTSLDDYSHDFIVTVCRNAGLNVTKFTGPKLAQEFLII